MSALERISITIEKDLIREFDDYRKKHGVANRSEAFRDLIRQRLIEQDWEAGNKEVVATVTIVYDHGKREISDRLTSEAHHHHGLVMASMHIHLNEHNCLEVITLRGKPSELRRFAEQIIAMKGVLHGKFVMSAPTEIGN